MKHFTVLLLRGLVIAALLGSTFTHADSLPSAYFSSTGKAAPVEALRRPAGAIPTIRIQLAALDPSDIDAVKQANATTSSKELQIGITRDVERDSLADMSALVWQRAEGGIVAHWEVTSRGATALRLGLRVRGQASGAELRFVASEGGTVYGPFRVDEVAGQPVYWSPMLSGESAVIELFVPDGAPLPDVAIAQVSHLLANPVDPNVDALLKASGSCNVDLVCRSPNDAGLATIGNAVAKMLFQRPDGSFICTGTLLNSSVSPQPPYFYTANHCISTQDVAGTLSTFWFYDRTGCGAGSTNPGSVQLSGGATLLYANTASDVSFMRLNTSPPAGAMLAGWNSAALPVGTATTAVHHPAGDWKKVSLGNVTRFVTLGSPSGSFIQIDWTLAVTEGGSSGSGIFSQMGSDYQLRGGLYGGASACGAPAASMNDFYSRFDQAFPNIQKYLNPAQTPTLTVTKAGSGSGSVTSTLPAGAIACGADCTETFPNTTTVTLLAAPAVGNVFTGWLGGCIGPLLSCTLTVSANTSVSATFAPGLTIPKVDVDANTPAKYDPLTDGIMILRFLFGLNSVTANAIGPGATRTTDAAIIQHLTDIKPLFDVDGNGVADPLTDGLMLLRYMFQLRGGSLISNAVGTGASRTTVQQIEAYLAAVLQ